MVCGPAEGRAIFMDLLNYGSGSDSDDGLEDGPPSVRVLESEVFEEEAEGAEREQREEEEIEEDGAESEGTREIADDGEEEEFASSAACPSLEELSASGGGCGGLSREPTKSVSAIESLLVATPLSISKILEGQEAILAKRRMFVGSSRRKKRRAIFASGRVSNAEPTTMGERWRRYLQSLEEDFFTSKEARMEEAG